jgi:peptide deformylase
MKHLSLIIICVIAASCQKSNWTDTERNLIESHTTVMRILTVDNPADSLVLREKSTTLSKAEIQSKLYQSLAKKMIATVTSQQNAVGIAGPQTGITRRVVAVQRFDKAGEPFEVYPNIYITAMRGTKEKGPEGCLSVPPIRGLVPRYTSAIVSYIQPETLEPKRDTVTGYTAVIFQHECDHLDGILYIDRADTVYVSPSWEAERRAYDYTRPEWWPLP